MNVCVDVPLRTYRQATMVGMQKENKKTASQCRTPLSATYFELHVVNKRGPELPQTAEPHVRVTNQSRA
jgi:hypothetical protein